MTAKKETRRRTSTRKACARIGMPGYIDILSALKTKPRSKIAVQAATGLGHTAINPILASMHVLRLIHVSGWNMEYDCPTEPVFSYGPGEDAPPPTKRPSGHKVRGVRIPKVSRPRSEIVALAHLLRCLQEPITKDELHEQTGLSATAIRSAIRQLQKRRIAYVSCWVDAPGRSHALCAAFELGGKLDAPRPRALTKNEIAKRYRDARKAKEATSAIVMALAANDPFRAAA